MRGDGIACVRRIPHAAPCISSNAWSRPSGLRFDCLAAAICMRCLRRLKEALAVRAQRPISGTLFGNDTVRGPDSSRSNAGEACHRRDVGLSKTTSPWAGHGVGKSSWLWVQAKILRRRLYVPQAAWFVA